MSQDHVRTDRSYPLDAYEYLRTAAMSDWAWEYLRRNPDYQSDALAPERSRCSPPASRQRRALYSAAGAPLARGGVGPLLLSPIHG